MLAFITSIRHPHNTSSYLKAIKLFEISARSICAQTNGNFVYIVVCNKKPELDFHDERIHYHVVDYPVPPSLEEYKKEFSIDDSDVSCHPKKYFPNRGDKGTKILSGLLFAKRFSPKYIYIVDADDWININIVKFLEEQADYPIWHVNEAHVVNFKKKSYTTRYGISRHCGSTFIYSFEYLMSLGNFSKEIDHSSSQQELMAASSIFFVHDICGNHTKQYNLATRSGNQPKALPFPSICYVLETGENEVQHIDVNDCFPINQKLINEFGLSNNFLARPNFSLTRRFRQSLAALKSKVGWKIDKMKVQNAAK